MLKNCLSTSLTILLRSLRFSIPLRTNDVYAYITKLRKQETVVIRYSIVSLNSSFVETARLYEKRTREVNQERTTAINDTA